MPVLTETVHHASGTFVAGTDLPKSHDLFRDAPHLFESAAPVVEAATAAPGEKRATPRARRPKA